MMFGQSGYAGIPMTPGVAPGIQGLSGLSPVDQLAGLNLAANGGNTQQLQPFNPGNVTPLSNRRMPGVTPPAGQQSRFGAFKDQMGGWGGMAKFGLDAVVGLGELYAASRALKLSEEQFNFNKQFSQDQLANSVKTHNTRLTDRATARAVMEGTSDADRDAYIERNRLTRGA